jgi:hypothetical protein
MNPLMEEQVARQRLDEARAEAARWTLLRQLRPARHPLRVAVGFALIKVGHWVAGRASRRAGQPRRATA